MSFEWIEVHLKEVTTIIGDGLHGTPEYDESGDYFFINGNNLSEGRIIINTSTKRTSEAEYQKYKKTLNDKTILVSINGTLGNIALYHAEKVVLGKSACYLNVLDSADRQFIRYILTAPPFQQYIFNQATGSTIKNVSLKLMRNFVFLLPSFSEQKRISTILAALDDRIALLRETNTTLEAIAQALFKSWFVDFDPVRAKQEGREPEGMDADTAALFPDSFEESELGLVPKGWKIGKVDNILSRLSAKVRYTKDQIITDGVIPIYEQGAGILLGYHNGPAQFLADERNPAFIFGDHTCVTHLSCEPFDISQNVIPLKGKDRATLWVYYAVKDKQAFQEYRRHWMELIVKDIVIPTPQICEAYANIVSIYHLKMESNVHQLRTITSIRDTLLPRLISGQLRIPEAEALIEETAA